MEKLRLQLSGILASVSGQMEDAKRVDYKLFKQQMLERVGFTKAGAQKCFREIKREDNKSFPQLIHRLG